MVDCRHDDGWRFHGDKGLADNELVSGLNVVRRQQRLDEF